MGKGWEGGCVKNRWKLSGGRCVKVVGKEEEFGMQGESDRQKNGRRIKG